MDTKIYTTYSRLVQLVSSGNIDKARTLLESLELKPSQLRDIEHALLRDTGRTIT